MNNLYISKGEKVIFKGVDSLIIRVLTVNKVSIEEIESGIIHTVKVSDLEKPNDNSKNNFSLPIHALNEKDLKKATVRYDLIKPILENRGNLLVVKNQAKEGGVSLATIYRWVKIFDECGLVSALIGKRKSGGVGKSRLSEMLNDVIENKIHSIYLTKDRKSIPKTIREIQIACNDLGIDSPHENTIRNRIKNISSEERIRKRFGDQEAKAKYEPIKGSFPGAEFPLSVVQIDHTPVDIILVDEERREALKRPWLTLAMDVYSRLVVGFYLSFETPGTHGTGICIANSILPKEMWLEERNVSTEWPSWGIMNVIHLDNAKEFRGKSLRDSCNQYGISLEFRPIGKPHWGGHVERLLGAFSKEIHNLPGTTFSNVSERKRYQSEKNACFTLSEFEKWLTIYITNVYHKRVHSTTKQTPLERYNQGLVGDKTNLGVGIPPRINDERRTRLDFMPIVERTVQEYGVVIDHIYYYDDILRAFIHSEDKQKNKIKHVFKRDPRDISRIYFYHKEMNDYFEIPYRDASLPPMTIWEHNHILNTLKKNRIEVDEGAIFNAYRDLNELEDKVIRETRRKSSKSIKKNKEKINKTIPHSEDIITNDEVILPFDDIEDETFNN